MYLKKYSILCSLIKNFNELFHILKVLKHASRLWIKKAIHVYAHAWERENDYTKNITQSLLAAGITEIYDFFKNRRIQLIAFGSRASIRPINDCVFLNIFLL